MGIFVCASMAFIGVSLVPTTFEFPLLYFQILLIAMILLAVVGSVGTGIWEIRISMREGKRSLEDSPPPPPSTEPELRTHRSIHHLFGERERLLPKKGDPSVDLALDAADLPEGLLSYLELLARNGREARLLLLDPDSPLVSRHRFAATAGLDHAEPATESIRAKMRKAIASMQSLAKVRLYDAVPLGNLVIVGEHIFWGGIPSVPTDVSLPVVELDADVHGELYWSYRRNFDRLWEAAKPADALAEPPPQPASQAG